jgi:glycosyltransferase involved in cell wall biosynthesis
MNFSIIMPAFNAEATICKSVQSVIDQTYDNWELIIINDGSTDNTLNIINS